MQAILQTIAPVLLVVHVMIAVGLIGVVLMQRSEGGGLGMGGRSDAFMSVRGQANLLTRTTAILAGVFFLTSVLLAFAGGTHSKRASGFMTTPPAPGAPAQPGPQPGAGQPGATPGATTPGTGTAPGTPPQAPTR